MKDSDLPPAYGSTSNQPSQIEIPKLPRKVTLRQVYSDFIKYLYDHTEDFFVESTPNGQNIWNRLQSKIMLIFCHPNGWDISQQAFLSDCAVGAGIMSEDEIDARIDFVTEGEASVHYALAYTPSMTWLQPGRLFVVVDAGGSTIDSNLYECKSTNPLRLEEAHRSECIQVYTLLIGTEYTTHFFSRLVVYLWIAPPGRCSRRNWKNLNSVPTNS
jgi:hypothetical protein